MIKRDLTNRESMIMKCVWKNEEGITLQGIQEELKEMFDCDVKKPTIQTYLTSIEGKGFIEIERRGRRSYVKPSVSEEKHKKEQVEKMADFWYNGSKKGLVKTLVNGKLSEESEQYLMDLLDRLDKK